MCKQSVVTIQNKTCKKTDFIKKRQQKIISHFKVNNNNNLVYIRNLSKLNRQIYEYEEISYCM